MLSERLADRERKNKRVADRQRRGMLTSWLRER